MRAGIVTAAGLCLVMVCAAIGCAVLVGIVQAGSGCGAPTPSAAGQPPLVQYYLGAAARYGLGDDGYAYLAGINNVETGFGTNPATSSAGAIGWMQFEPSTWAQYGVSVSDPGAPPDPDNPQDAIYGAAHLLSASGAPGSWPTAIYAYNHSSAYVSDVLGLAARYRGPAGLQALAADIATAWKDAPDPPPPAAEPASLTTSAAADADAGDPSGDCGAPGTTAASGTLGPVDVTPVPGQVGVIMPSGLARPPAGAPQSVQAMIAAGDRLVDQGYSYGGGHCVAAMNQQQADPSACVGEQEYGYPGYDCSSSTSYVLYGGGLGSLLDGSVPDSGTLAGLGAPGPGKWVTWMANDGHVYIEVAGIWLNTENGEYLHDPPQPPAAPASGPRWSTGNSLNSLDRPGFSARHPEGL